MSTSDERPQTIPASNRDTQIESGALAAAGIIFLIAIIPLKPLDQPLIIALYAFSAALPLLVLGFMLSTLVYLDDPGAIPEFIGGIGVLVGMSATIWHVNAEAGAIFAGLSFLCLVVFVILALRSPNLAT